MIDPFTHFVWLELVNVKSAPTIVKAFVQRILCEEGQPRYMLTDNGTEFKNKIFKDLMKVLEVDYQFSPAYHPLPQGSRGTGVGTARLLYNICCNVL